MPRRDRLPEAHRPRRRRDCLGELVQIDGCNHEWFEDRGPRCTLLVYGDDASGKLMELSFGACTAASGLPCPWYAHAGGEAVRALNRVSVEGDRLARVRNYFYTPTCWRKCAAN